MTILNQTYNQIKDSISHLGEALLELVAIIHYDEQQEVLQSVLDRLDDPFMFVVVGEVKSGKSSFINALLDPGKEICRVAAAPMTDIIQQIVYGTSEREEYISPYLKRVFQPINILREVAIVDTPGTNTMIAHHQEITEKFIPMSDLIIFVFEAKNPYRQSAWDFFDFIKEEWHKKVIFILQQKDLVNEEDLAVNLEGVKQFAIKKGISSPAVFAVSALEEIEGNTGNSGFSLLKSFIQSNITGGKAPFLKLSGSVQTIQNINVNLKDGMQIRKAQLDADLLFRSEIRQTLDQQQKQTNEQVDILVENIIAKYDQVTHKYSQRLDERLGIFTVLKKSFQSIFNKKESLKTWLEGMIHAMESELRDGMSQKLGEGVKNIAESIQFMAKLIDAKLQKNKTILTKNHEIFSDLAEKRANILRELLDTFANFLNREENFYDKNMLERGGNFSPDFAKGSGIAIIGIILSAVTNGLIFDITGGILTTLGIIFAGVSIGIKRKKIVAKFNSEIADGRLRLQENIDEKMKNYVDKIKHRIVRNFHNFDQYLEKEQDEITAIDQKQDLINDQLESINIMLKEHIETHKI